MNEEEKQKVGKRFFDVIDKIMLTPDPELVEKVRQNRRKGNVYQRTTQAIGDAKDKVLGTVFSPIAKGIEAVSDATNIDERGVSLAGELIMDAVLGTKFSKGVLSKTNRLGRRLGGKLQTVDGSTLDNVVDVANPYKVTSQTQQDILSQVNNKITSKTPITITSTGNVPSIVMGGPGSGRKKKVKPSFGQRYIDFTYSNVNEEIEKPKFTEADLTDEDRIRYGQMNVESAINIDDYISKFGASTIRRKSIRTEMVEPFKEKYGATDEQVREFVNLANRSTRDIAKTVKYLNYEYQLSLPQAYTEDIAAELSLVFRQNITPETIDAIIDGQGGEIIFQTQGMIDRKEDPIIITDRQSLLAAYIDRLNTLNVHGAFDKGHVYATNSILKDNKISNASMYRNLEPEMRATIQQLVSPVELKQLIKGQVTEGTDYLDKIIGNRSKKAGSDPADKIFERLYGNAYGLEEDFKNFLFPKQNLANMIHPDLKPLFGRKYTRIVRNAVKEIESSGQLKVGDQLLNIIRLRAMKKVLKDYVKGTEITVDEEKAQASLANVQAFLDFVTGKQMVNPETGTILRGDEDEDLYNKLKIENPLSE
tara:strand:- start:2231 stop:4006 length:1776 start_codon:yes stop_codon:yes gene_type:complete